MLFRSLLRRNASERAIAAKLAIHLAQGFPDHDVDVEYDRHGLAAKTLELPAECRGGGKRRVIPDIVIHHRGSDDENLVAIEIKKRSNKESRDYDRAKLVAMKSQLRYRVAVSLELPVGAEITKNDVSVEWI